MHNLEITNWLNTQQGGYIRQWVETSASQLTADVFGYHALQIGSPEFDLLSACRIPLKQKLATYCSYASSGTENIHVGVCGDPCHLPFASNSVDLVVLPYVLEYSHNPHQVLREVERILIPEGRLLLIAFNPFSLWGVARAIRRRKTYPWNGHFFTILRLKDWFKLLGLEAERGLFGCFAPPCRSEKWLRRFAFLEHAGERWWTIAGAVYCLRAVKRLRGMHLVGPAWRELQKTTVLPAATREARKVSSLAETLLRREESA